MTADDIHAWIIELIETNHMDEEDRKLAWIG
jgi:hypothetical protein